MASVLVAGQIAQLTADANAATATILQLQNDVSDLSGNALADILAIGNDAQGQQIDGVSTLNINPTSNAPNAILAMTAGTVNTVSPASFNWCVGGEDIGGIQTNTLQLFSYDNGSFSTKLLQSSSPDISNQGILNFSSYNQQGRVSIATRAQTYTVNNPYVQANSVIMLTVIGEDTNVISARVSDIVPNTSFTIELNAACNDGTDVAWFIVNTQ